MHEAGVQEEISHQLIQMEVAGQKEMQTSDVSQVDASHLENKRSKECQQINNQQILGNGWYTEHHIIYDLQIDDLSIYDLQIDYLRFCLAACFARKITKNICFSCRKELEYNYFSIKK